MLRRNNQQAEDLEQGQGEAEEVEAEEEQEKEREQEGEPQEQWLQKVPINGVVIFATSRKC